MNNLKKILMDLYKYISKFIKIKRCSNKVIIVFLILIAPLVSVAEQEVEGANFCEAADYSCSTLL